MARTAQTARRNRGKKRKRELEEKDAHGKVENAPTVRSPTSNTEHDVDVDVPDDAPIHETAGKAESSRETKKRRTCDEPSSTNKSDTGNSSRPKQLTYAKSVAARDPSLLSDLFAQQVQKYFDELSPLERSDINIPSSAFKDTTSFTESHVEAQLPKFLDTYAEGGKNALTTCSETASPHTAIVVSAGLRVADLYRSLLVFNTDDCKVGKLITKHMKLKQMVKYLQETKVGIIITTPTRLDALIKEGALEIGKLRRIVIDGSYQNEKEQTVFDMPDLFKQLMDMLNYANLKPKLGTGQGQIEVLVY